MLYGVRIPDTRDKAFMDKHPFLATLTRATEGKPVAFPFWYKKYPTRRHAYETRFNIPQEMLQAYPENVRRAVSKEMMSVREKEIAQESMYTERYAQHDFDTDSPAVLAVKKGLRIARIRNHLLQHPHNNLKKMILGRMEASLMKNLRTLRKIDFKKYWEILRDHDVQDILQPPNNVGYRWGQYWRHDWNAGNAISTNIADFMDPKGLNGCIETGRSRSEVARDLGLTYTRPLFEHEKKQLSQTATYYERLAKFKAEQPEAAKQAERQRFIRKFSGMFLKRERKSNCIDFPSTYRRLLHIKVLRWKSKRHGPA
jgi:hypothetical protein